MLFWHPLSADAYAADRYTLLATVEGVRLTPYRDSVGLVTIGIGFNINDPQAPLQAPVFSALGLPAESPARDKLTALFATSSSGDALRAAADAIVAEALGPGHACALTEAQCRALLDKEAAAYEASIDRWMPGVPPSRERLALVSLAWNGILAASPSLHRALQSGARAEAWYQVRYNSNGGASKSRGIAIRRALEGSLIGLYEGSGQKIPAAEARAVLAAYTAHQAAITAAETAYPGVAAAANANYVPVLPLLPDGRVPTLDEALAPARGDSGSAAAV